MLQQVDQSKVVGSPVLPGIKIYADGADLTDFLRLYREGMVSGFTTNPSLMRRAGITDYVGFAKSLLAEIKDYPISFEVFSDDLAEMERQARQIASWGENVYVKVPITNTKGQSCLPMVSKLSKAGVKINVTAILTLEQVTGTVEALSDETPGIISIFAGRIADTGVNPEPLMRAAVAMAAQKPSAEVLWASTREAYNLYQARDCGCHIITSTPDVLKKLEMSGQDLAELSLDTVAMFYRDAQQAGYTI